MTSHLVMFVLFSWLYAAVSCSKKESTSSSSSEDTRFGISFNPASDMAYMARKFAERGIPLTQTSGIFTTDPSKATPNFDSSFNSTTPTSTNSAQSPNLADLVSQIRQRNAASHEMLSQLMSLQSLLVPQITSFPGFGQPAGTIQNQPQPSIFVPRPQPANAFNQPAAGVPSTVPQLPSLFPQPQQPRMFANQTNVFSPLQPSSSSTFFQPYNNQSLFSGMPNQSGLFTSSAPQQNELKRKDTDNSTSPASQSRKNPSLPQKRTRKLPKTETTDSHELVPFQFEDFEMVDNEPKISIWLPADALYVIFQEFFDKNGGINPTTMAIVRPVCKDWNKACTDMMTSWNVNGSDLNKNEAYKLFVGSLRGLKNVKFHMTFPMFDFTFFNDFPIQNLDIYGHGIAAIDLSTLCGLNSTLTKFSVRRVFKNQQTVQFFNIQCFENMKTLKILDIPYFLDQKPFKNESVVNLTTELRNVEKSDITQTGEKNSFMDYFPNLESVTIYELPRGSTVDFNIFKGLTKLKNIEIRMEYSNSNFEESTESFFTFTNSEILKSLDSLEELKLPFPDVTACSQLGNQNLKKLTLSSIYSLSTTELYRLLKNFPNLQELTIDALDVTISIEDGKVPTFPTVLRFTLYSQTERLDYSFLESFPNLQYLMLDAGIQRMKPLFLENLGSFAPDLEELTLLSFDILWPEYNKFKLPKLKTLIVDRCSCKHFGQAGSLPSLEIADISAFGIGFDVSFLTQAPQLKKLTLNDFNHRNFFRILRNAKFEFLEELTSHNCPEKIQWECFTAHQPELKQIVITKRNDARFSSFGSLAW